ncbi:MAG: NUDIX domain-containing protein [Alphaproteobacteria bacterium]|nr:NUDIX domain-containing protein [Alphaproteobacteria bacterium]
MPAPLTLPAHPDVTIDSAETVWQGRFPLQVVRFRQRRFDGAMSGPRRWELWRRGRAAAFLPYDPRADAVVLIEQFRLPALAAGVDPVLVELPAGLCDGDEGPEATILREAEEEMGQRPSRLRPVGDFLLTPGGCDEHVAIYVGEVTAPPADAEGLAGAFGLAHEEEDIRLRVWPAAAAIEAAVAGRFVNSVTAIALLWFGLKREQVRQEWGTS